MATTPHPSPLTDHAVIARGSMPRSPPVKAATKTRLPSKVAMRSNVE